MVNDIIEHELVPQSAVQVRTQVKAIQEVLHAVMKKDVHYGVIPGTQKPTLYKAGAEILLTTFRISVDPEIEDLSTQDEIRYRVKARGIANAEIRLGNISGHVVGAGVGEASTNEEKYKWHGAGEKEWENTPEDRRRIKYGWKWGQARGEKVDTEIKQVRTEPADLANTVLKMAKKRAQIDLCLTALSASDVFDQDLEDLAPEHTQGRVNPKAQSSAPTSSSGSNNNCTAAQCGLLRAKLNGGPFNEVDLCAEFDITALEQLPFEKVNDAIAWIASQ